MPARSRASDRERGAVLVMFSLLLVAMIIVVALVLDLSVVRADRKSNKKTADIAAAAGVRALWHPDGRPRPWPAVCQAYNYLRGNSSEVSTFGTETWKLGSGSTVLGTDGSGADIVGSPCPESPEYEPLLDDLLNMPCSADNLDTWAWFDGVSSDGRITVTIKSGYSLPDAFETAPAGDSGEPCKQVGVIVQETAPRGFSAAFTSNDLESSVRSVARIIIGDEGDAIAALVLLERRDCLALNIEGGSGAKAEVMGLAEVPGIIHADALGDGADCGTPGDTENVFNLTTNSSSPLIVAHQAGDGTPGIIQARALEEDEGGVPGNASDPSPEQVNAEGQPGPPEGSATPGPLAGRRRIDQRYLSPLKILRAEAVASWTTPSTILGASYATYGCTLPTTVPETRVYVDCDTVTVTSDTAFTGERARIIFKGSVIVEGGPTTGARLSFKNPEKLYIAGSATGPGLSMTRPVHVNLDGKANCSSRADYTDESDPERLETTQVVVGQGPFTGSGNAAMRMCQTTLLMGDSSGAIACPMPATAEENLAPYANDCRGRISVAGSGVIDWSAPNRTSLAPDSDDFANLEDLAFWTETSSVPGNTCGPTNNLNCVQGGGAIRMTGIFVLPNANPFRIAGSSTAGLDIEANAQFWTRKLTVAGNATLRMAPNPNDATPIPVIKGFALVR